MSNTIYLVCRHCQSGYAVIGCFDREADAVSASLTTDDGIWQIDLNKRYVPGTSQMVLSCFPLGDRKPMDWRMKALPALVGVQVRRVHQSAFVQ